MAKYTKSHSNYQLKSRHQLTSDGTVYERDMSTIGGIDTVAPGQIPVYRSGNFVISVNNERRLNRKMPSSIAWEDNNGSENWTISTISDHSLEDTYTPKEIKLKRDVYDLRDFAYYGSCSELIRTSVGNVLKKYPGEMFLYADTNKTYMHEYYESSVSGTVVETFDSLDEARKIYPDYNGTNGNGWSVNSNPKGLEVYYNKGTNNEKRLEKGGSPLYAVDNPFGLNLIDSTKSPSEDENPLRYLLFENTYEKYDVIKSDGTNFKLSIDVEYNLSGSRPCPGDLIATIKVGSYSRNYVFNVTPSGQVDVPTSGENVTLKVTESYYTETSTDAFTMYAYAIDDGYVAYVVDFNGFDINYFNCHIRPRNEFYMDYMAELSEFERVIVNPNSEPQRTMRLNLLGENEFGYYTYNRAFTFPTTYGGYNLSVDAVSNTAYLQELSKIAEFYDDRFCDNIWRSMTHEGIKNLDWSREKNDDRDYYENSYGRMEKTLRVAGAFFDNIKSYADNLKNTNRVTYDNANNLPDYFFTDKLNEQGWDAIQITPYKYTDGKFSQAWSDEEYVEPYLSPSATNLYCGCFNGEYSGTSEDPVIDDEGNPTTNVKQMVMPARYTFPEVNNEFMKRLLLNSKYILRRKGTLDGIEMILSLFGMKSSRLSDDYDYKVEEYTIKAKDVVVDSYNANVEAFEYDFINRYKAIAYDTKEYINGINVPYVGLPVTYTQENGKRYLYPEFNAEYNYDGNPYYQMKGGWMKKYPYTFDADDVVVDTTVDEVYGETAKEIRTVEDIKELVDLSYYDLRDGEIVTVMDITGHYAIVDGIVYDLYTEDIDGIKYTYFSVTVSNNSVVVGNTYFENIITVSDPFYEGQKHKCILEGGEMDGREIRIYLIGETTPMIYAYTNVTSISSFFEYNGEERIQGGYTNYFKLNNAYSAGEISESGWHQLKESDKDYRIVNTIKNENRGNNPHIGHLDYDNGASYLRVFNKLFNYSIDNDLFKERIYSIDSLSDDVSIMIDSFGFDIKGLSTDVCDDNYDSGMTLDDKILIACDTFDHSGRTKTSDELIKEATMKDSGLTEYANFSGLSEHKSNLIMNIKRMDITFYVTNDDISTDECKLQVKYIEGVILPYLSQMIPSSTICKIIYAKKQTQ